ncbi:SH2 domain-containing protein 1A-like isoform X2 [Fundulus heteroclitus]|uniref:SH2 domain-containing protein 1A-like isoform X2 n=1 Tax=Fundulus heteroclitus TaxID=8078 RepID=UPI00165CB106|nr:SH2 domain-containing protein 1A-like isoform X2 [Fundulus heteroclitus]
METEGVLVRSIYYGRIGSRATEKLLETFGRDGSFLLRDSSTVRGAYCLCVRKAPFVHTYRLERDADGWYLQDLRNGQLRFGTLESLIQHYGGHEVSHLGIVPLTHPLDKTTVPSSWIQGLVYMEVNGSSSS